MKILDFIVKNEGKFIIIILIISIFFSSILLFKGINYEFDEENFLPDNKIVKANEKILKEYENEYIVPILIKAKNGNVLLRENLIEILKIEDEIRKNINAEPLSIADVISYAILLKKAGYEEKIKAMENISNESIIKIINYPFFPKNLLDIFLSNDFNGKRANATIIKLSLDGSLIKDKDKAFENESKIKSIVDGYEYNYIEATVLGYRIISDEIIKSSNRSISFLLPISFILVIIVLILFLRSIYDVVLSLLSLSLSIIWIYGFAALLNFSLNPLTTSIPVLLVGLGIDYSIHLKMRINEEKSKEKALKGIGIALILSALTTSMAFLSNVSSEIENLKEFGILSSFGILSCLFITIIITSKKERETRERKILITIGKFAEGKGKYIIALAILLTIIMLYSALHIKAEFDIMDFLPKKLMMTKDINYLFKNFQAMQREEADVIITANICHPEVIKKIYYSIENMKDDSYIIKSGNEYEVYSILSLMKDYANKSFFDFRYNENFSLLYSSFFENGLPKENVTSNDVKKLYDFLFGIAPNDVKYVLNENYNETVIRIATNTGKNEANISILYDELKNDIEIENAIITGGIISNYIILKEIRNSQLKSLLLTILFSFIILEIVFYIKKKSFLIGIIALSPIIISSIWILGTMNFLNIPLTITTITTSSLAIGLGIDYSIHITHKFMEEKDFISTISSTGFSLIGSALTTISAFGLLSFSLIPPLRIFGISVAISIFYSLICCIFILPILLDFFK